MMSNCPHCGEAMVLFVQQPATAAARAIRASASYFAISERELRRGRRRKTVSRARHIAMWLMRDAGFSFNFIGDEFGRDHSTVQYGCKRVDADDELRREALRIRDELGPAGVSACPENSPKAETRIAVRRAPLNLVTNLAKNNRPRSRMGGSSRKAEVAASEFLDESAGEWEAAE